MTRRALLAAILIALCAPPPAAHAQTIRDQQWHLDALAVPAAHEYSRGRGVVVAVVDSGVDDTVPDLAGGAVLPGVGFASATGTKGTEDTDGHGTAMAALIAGRGHDGGALGVAPEATILPVSVGSDGAKFTTAAVAEGITWAVDNGADVINLSLTTEATLTPDLLRAVNHAFDHDVVVVAGTGNDGVEHIGAPANIRGVLAVAGTERDLVPWGSSNTGPEAVLAAPAKGIVSAVPKSVVDTGYAEMDGTSAATALVSGAAALVRATYPDMNAASVVNRLITTATDAGVPGRDDATGFGQVDPVAAITADVADVERNPLAPPPRTTAAPVPTTAAPPVAERALNGPAWSGGARAGIAFGGLLAILVGTAVAGLLLSRTRRPEPPPPVPAEIPPPPEEFWKRTRW
ncbi:S8 family serine peptidase [Saccharothrix sp.]|uniref:S8 family serine peptidase n=1 Tax=Saccharothrix sp. TaxID=1873460 RepID=UPI002810D75D|nr:S8 family serine peptidase [Saccharothrix sp.]